jgi:type VI protein secretion system component VasA
MLRKHYEQVLKQLREDAETLAGEQPDLAVNFRRENTDPDVSKLLEGLALLAARQNIQLENDQLEQQQGWLQAVAPNALLPMPCMAILALDPPSQVDIIPPLNKFSSTSSGDSVSWLNVSQQRHLPLKINDVTVDKKLLSITLECLGDIENIQKEKLNFQLLGELTNSQQIAMSLSNHVRSIRIGVSKSEDSWDWLSTPKQDWNIKYQVTQGSWLNGILHHKVHHELSWVEESLRFPQRGLSFDLNLNSLSQIESLEKGQLVEIQWTLDSAMATIPKAEDFSLHTVPLINLDDTDLLPFNRNANESLYELAFANPDVSQSQFFGIKRIYEQVAQSQIEYTSLAGESWRSEQQGSYQLLRQESAPFLQARLAKSSDEIGLMRTTAWIHQEDIALPLLTGSPVTGSRSGTLISAPSMWRLPLSSHQAQWTVLKQQQVAHAQTSLASFKELLCSLLLHENNNEELQSLFKGHIEAIVDLRFVDDEIVRGTSVVLGQHVTIELDENGFRTDGQCWYFSSLLWQLFRSRLPINGVLAMTVENVKHKELHHWPHASGTRALV